ncbi:hypothetical protein, partial [Campylobacter coli]|uniref:hypothetical protein n=1 Tax=Campylobacter coli TaxID=195 RepID=UPI003F7BD484
MESPCGDGEANKEWQREDGKREKQPAEETDADNDEDWSKGKHGGGLREIDKRLAITPSTTTT